MLFFNDPLISVLISAVFLPVVIKMINKSDNKKQNKHMETHFCEVLQIMASSLSAGSSVESALLEVQSELSGKNERSYEKIKGEFLLITNGLMMNRSCEELLNEFAIRTGVSNIQNFSSAFELCRTAGGNMVDLFRNAAMTLRIKLDTEKEIIRILNLPKFNHKILTGMPFVLILMLRITSPSYIASLMTGYGKLIMLAVLAIIIVAWFIGNKISDIRI
ncbi:MAG: hypothetical protein LBI03_07010 [Clostridiales bacterium]|nr:hypothetical protein [Clostridiales bacterium]